MTDELQYIKDRLNSTDYTYWADAMWYLLNRLEAAEAALEALRRYHQIDSWDEIPGSVVEMRKAKIANATWAAWLAAKGET